MIWDLKNYQAWMEKCSYCSFCEATCPVFLADLLETHVARSRMKIIQNALLSSNLALTPRVHDIINRCLLCTKCQQTCPCGVPVDEIVISARHQLYHGKRKNMAKRFLMRKIMEKRGVKGLLKQLEPLAKAMGFSPKEIPPIPAKSFADLYQGTYSTKGQARSKVAYFVGCATNTIYPDTGDAVMKVLQQNNIEVTLPEKLVCCGIPALVEGDLKTAREMMHSNITILAALEVDAIISDCTSCVMVLKDKLLKVIGIDDPLRSQAETVAAKIQEVSLYLNTIGLSQQPSALNCQYTYHVPCHSSWSPDISEAPRQLISEIPGTDLVEMEDADKCCGAAGTFFTEYQELSQKIQAPKLDNIKNTGVNTVVTPCPSCRFYLKAGLKENQEVIHPIAFLAKAYALEA